MMHRDENVGAISRSLLSRSLDSCLRIRCVTSDPGLAIPSRTGAARGVRSHEERPLTVETFHAVFAGQGPLLHSLRGLGRGYIYANSDVVVLTSHAV
jgi:hypothetical protein